MPEATEEVTLQIARSQLPDRFLALEHAYLTLYQTIEASLGRTETFEQRSMSSAAINTARKPVDDAYKTLEKELGLKYGRANINELFTKFVSDAKQAQLDKVAPNTKPGGQDKQDKIRAIFNNGLSPAA